MTIGFNKYEGTRNVFIVTDNLKGVRHEKKTKVQRHKL